MIFFQVQTADTDTTKAAPSPQLPPQKKFFCPCCNHGYVTSDEMINHIKQSPIKVKTYCCNVCLLEFFIKSDLIDHQRLDHQMAVSKKYKCDECALDYNNMAQLARHKRMHEDIAQKLAASGIFLPRPGKGDLNLNASKKDQSSEGDTAASHSHSQSYSTSHHSQQDASKTSILRRQLTGDKIKKSVQWGKSGHTETKNDADVRKKSQDKEAAGKHSDSEQKLAPACTKEDSPLKHCEPDDISEEDEGDLPLTPGAPDATDDEDNDPDYSTSSVPQAQSSSAVRRSRRQKTDVAKYLPKEQLESGAEKELGGSDCGTGDRSPADPAPRVKRKKRKRGRPRLSKNLHASSRSKVLKKNKQDVEEVEIPAVSVLHRVQNHKV